MSLVTKLTKLWRECLFLDKYNVCDKAKRGEYTPTYLYTHYTEMCTCVSRTDLIFQAYEKREKKKTAREENEIPSIVVDSTRVEYIFPLEICTSSSNES